MKHYAASGVSVKETSLCIGDEDGRLCRELKDCSHPEDISGAFSGTSVRLLRVGLEAGPLCQWLFEALPRLAIAARNGLMLGSLLTRRYARAPVSALLSPARKLLRLTGIDMRSSKPRA